MRIEDFTITANGERLWAGGEVLFRLPMTSAGFLTKVHWFILMPGFIRPLEQKLKHANI
jgi:hypothetical protein